ncbi:hypothetical protein HK405_003630, partial [Cladochytrium tenue]
MKRLLRSVIGGVLTRQQQPTEVLSSRRRGSVPPGDHNILPTGHSAGEDGPPAFSAVFGCALVDAPALEPASAVGDDRPDEQCPPPQNNVPFILVRLVRAIERPE